jgi:hypothetical protein
MMTLKDSTTGWAAESTFSTVRQEGERSRIEARIRRVADPSAARAESGAI